MVKIKKESEKELATSNDYKTVFEYMITNLVEEFNQKEINANYLLLSILDNPQCYAGEILDNCLMTDAISGLKEELANSIIGNITSSATKVSKIIMSDELTGIIYGANTIAAKLNSPFVGSQHFLLSMLYPSHHYPIGELLNKYQITYQTIFDKCLEIDSYQRNNAQHFIDKLKSASGLSDLLNNQRMALKSDMGQSSIAVMSPDFINKYTININDEVKDGKADNLVGREKELNNIIKVLARRKKNNVVLVGNGGVGKTSIVYGLAKMIIDEKAPEILADKQIVMLDTMALVSGTNLRGMFEERVNALIKELKSSSKYILFIDDMQCVLKTGKDKDTDLSDMLNNILTEGDVRVIGALSFKDYRNGIESNSTLARKLQKIVIEASSVDETFNILSSSKKYYETFHHVKYKDSVLKKAIVLAERYIINGSLPDSAIDVVDLTGANKSITLAKGEEYKELKHRLKLLAEKKTKAMSNGDFEKVDELSKEESTITKELSELNNSIEHNEDNWVEVSDEDIADTISDMTNIPVSKLNSNEKTNIVNIDNTLKKEVIGQDSAISDICKVIKRSRVGLSDNKKCSSFLMIGKTGCGKTLLAKKIAEHIFGDEKALIRFDMSEYQDKTSVNKLIGASAGYVGYESGGLLTEAVKNKPYCVLLFDEIEKADESIYNVFLQLLDEGRLTDNNGQSINFKNVIVIMTSNVGAKQASALGNGIGFQNNKEDNEKSIINKELKKKFNPEFLNRIDKIIYFNTLSNDNLKSIAKIEINKLVDLAKESHTYITYDDSVIDFVFNQAIKDKDYGARPIRRIVQDSISDKVVEVLLESTKDDNNKCHIVCENNEIKAELVG